MSLLTVKSLSVSIGKAPILKGLSFTVAHGEIMGIAGPSGSGKSMTGLALMGLLPTAAITTTQIDFDGSNLSDFTEEDWNHHRAHQAGMIFQEPMQALNPLHTIGHQIAEALRLASAPTKSGKKSVPHDGPEVKDLMAQVDLDTDIVSVSAYPHELSGGQRQRVVIAMALAKRPALMIADEPTTALDLITQADILALLKKIVREHQTSLILITHDLGVLTDYADTIMILDDGDCVEAGTASEIFRNPKHKTTQDLVAAARPAHIPPSPPPPDMPVVLAANQLTIGYAKADLLSLPWQKKKITPVIKQASFALTTGETLGIAGRSGCGKSTLLKALVGLKGFSGESLSLHGQSLAGRQRSREQQQAIQIVFQDPQGSFNPRQRVDHILSEPAHKLLPDLSNSMIKERMHKVLAQVGLPDDSLERFPHEFSGGQRQRLSIARALMSEPAIILFDEAVSALDTINRNAILALLQRLSRDRAMSSIFVSHDIAFLQALCQRILIIDDGYIVEEISPTTSASEANHPMTRKLLDAIPTLHEELAS